MVTKKVLKTIFQLRRATEAEWNEVNPILALGEPGYAYDIQKLKIGNGKKPWLELEYVNSNDFTEIIHRIENLHVSDLVDGDNYPTKEYLSDEYTSTTELERDYATKDYVDVNGGKIDSISVNGVPQIIDANKNVNIVGLNYRAGNGIAINEGVISLDQLTFDCGTSTRLV